MSRDQNCRGERTAVGNSTNEARPDSRYTVQRGVPWAGYLWKRPVSAPASAMRIECPFRSSTDVGNRENRMVAGWPGIMGSASARRKLCAGPKGGLGQRRGIHILSIHHAENSFIDVGHASGGRDVLQVGVNRAIRSG